MNYRIIPQKHFLKELKRLAKKYHSLKQDLQALQNELSSNPSAGIDLGCGIRLRSLLPLIPLEWR